MTPLALAFAILQTPHGSRLLGYILAAEILPNVLLLLIGGSIADRYRRDRLILLSYVGSGLSQAGIAAIVLTGSNPYGMFPFAIFNGVLGALTSPATRGMLPEIVHRQNIKQANALLNTSHGMARVLGPSVAGLFVATFSGGWAIAFDAASFFIAAACMLGVRIPSHAAVAKESLISQMRDGWDYFRHRRWIWLITGAFALMNPIQMGVWQVLGPIMAQHSYGATGWGLTLSIKAVGLLIASLAMLRFSLRRPVRDSMIAVAASGLPMIALGQGYPMAVLGLAAAVAGMGSAISRVAWDTALQQAVPADKISRVLAFDEFGSYITIPLGELMAVPLAGAVGYRTIATLGGIIFIGLAVLPLLEQQIRHMTRDDMGALNHSGPPL